MHVCDLGRVCCSLIHRMGSTLAKCIVSLCHLAVDKWCCVAEGSCSWQEGETGLWFKSSSHLPNVHLCLLKLPIVNNPKGSVWFPCSAQSSGVHHWTCVRSKRKQKSELVKARAFGASVQGIYVVLGYEVTKLLPEKEIHYSMLQHAAFPCSMLQKPQPDNLM